MKNPFIVTVANPAAGANFTYTLPNTFSKYLLNAVTFSFVTSAAVANRNVLCVISDAIPNYISSFGYGNTPIPASKTYLFRFMPNFPIDDTTSNTQIIRHALAVNLYLLPTYIISSTILGIDVADQLSAITLYFLV